MRSDQDLARIAFVTKRFRELQGFRTATYGAALIAGVYVSSFLPDGFRSPFITVAVPASIALGALTELHSHYYRHAFGAAGGSPRGPLQGETAWSTGAFGTVFVMIAFIVDMFNVDFGMPWPSAAALTVAGYSLWIALRDWPHRPHHIIGVAGGVIAVFVSTQARGTVTDAGRIDPELAVYLVLSYAILGLTLVAVGLCDHAFLVRAMSGGRSEEIRATASVMPSPEIAKARLFGGGVVLVSVGLFVAIAGWPRESVRLYLIVCLGLGAAAALVRLPVTPGQLRAYSELTRAREARLLQKMQSAIRGEILNEESDERDDRSSRPTPSLDLSGQLVLPMAIACGALMDIGARGAGLPSFLAIAVATSQLRVALRDWPRRAHYVLGAAMAAASAVLHMFVPPVSPLDWGIWFLILMSAAMALEGFLDYRLRPGDAAISKEPYADAV